MCMLALTKRCQRSLFFSRVFFILRNERGLKTFLTTIVTLTQSHQIVQPFRLCFANNVYSTFHFLHS